MARWALVTKDKSASRDGLLPSMAEVVEVLQSRALSVGGLVQRPVEVAGERVGYEIVRVRGAERPEGAIRAARRAGAAPRASEESFCSLVFDNDAFAAALEWVRADAGDSEVLVVDEVSKLEVAGRGHAASVTRALASGRVVVLGVRADQLFAVMERFGLPEPLATLDAQSRSAEAFAEAIARAVGSAVSVGGIDWQARWTEMVQAHCASFERDGPQSWDRRAHRFARLGAELPSEPLMSLLGPMLRPSDVVVDVGAGAGRHVVQLARRVEHVIAVEPSAGMRARLEEAVRSREIRNVTVVSDAWPTRLERAADVVFSSHVVYPVEDGAAFFDAMTRSARRLVAVYLAARPPMTALDRLWHAIHGFTRPRLPAAFEAVSLLWQLGHPAELRVVNEPARRMRFTTSDEDVRELCHRVGLAPDDAGAARVRAALERVGERDGDNGYQLGSVGPQLLLTWPGRAPVDILEP
ncbi:MAG: methyltransferase domain-containing protein [Deltaproteobacteria bacterium]|nr:methyltransferase domain-containing protein [Deltaproteobacteria bacterium]